MSDTDKLVTIDRLKALLSAYGAMPEHWPEEERIAATALIETSSEARILVEEAAALDALLETIPEPEVSAAITSRVRSMAFPAAARVPDGIFVRLLDLLRPQTRRGWQGAVAMAGILGIVAGLSVSPLMSDGAGPSPRVATTANPAALPELTDADIGETASTSLAPNLNAISLTGEELARSSSDDVAEAQSDAGEFTVASVPLY